jgi:hypothetical protein
MTLKHAQVIHVVQKLQNIIFTQILILVLVNIGACHNNTFVIL